MDGTILNTGILCLEILKYTVTKEGSIENYSAYSIAYQNSHFFQTANEEELIDTAILILTILSWNLPRKTEFVPKFQDVFDNITNKLIEIDNNLINCRLALFLGYYIDLLYKKDSGTFLNVLKLLTQSLISPFKALAI